MYSKGHFLWACFHCETQHYSFDEVAALEAYNGGWLLAVCNKCAPGGQSHPDTDLTAAMSMETLIPEARIQEFREASYEEGFNDGEQRAWASMEMAADGIDDVGWKY